MQNQPILSICIPTYNGARHLGHNLGIILDQLTKDRLTDVEVIVSDNCSTDNTAEIVASYQKKHPNILKYSKNEKNILFNGNFLKCCELAYGKYIHFLGDDDFYLPNGITRVLNVIKNDDSYSVVMLSNNWFMTQTNKQELRGDSDVTNDRILNSSFDLLKIASYRMWCVSDLVVKKEYLKDLENHLPNIPDWLQITTALYVASKKKHYYYFNDSAPILSIRLGDQTWLNSKDGPQIYLNNLRTFCAARKLGYGKDVINLEKDIFLNYAFYNQAIRCDKFKDNLKLAFKYFTLLYDKKRFYSKAIPRLFTKRT